MPLRYAHTGAALRPSTIPVSLLSRRQPRHQRLPFHSSPRALRLDDTSSNHYETLNVHPDASPAEIKKSFYLLSKRHHPDHNPTDPTSPSRFMRISEAYSVLGHADKRARYDRDVMRRRHHAHPVPHGSSRSSSSSGPAGGRPASGLSSRRRSSSFQGPPPSFFRSGGWGAHGAKRRAAHEESTGASHSFAGAGAGAGYGTDSHSPHRQHPGSSSSSSASGSGGTGGMGPGQDPFGHGGDVPHFDREAHERAQRRGEERRAQRMAERMGVRLEPEPSPVTSFWLVLGVLGAVIAGTVGVHAIAGWVSGPKRPGPGQVPKEGGERERERRGR